MEKERYLQTLYDVNQENEEMLKSVKENKNVVSQFFNQLENICEARTLEIR